MVQWKGLPTDSCVSISPATLHAAGITLRSIHLASTLPFPSSPTRPHSSSFHSLGVSQALAAVVRTVQVAGSFQGGAGREVLSRQ